MRSFALLALTAATALAVAASAAARSQGTTLNLVAYSTPQTVLGKLISMWNDTPQGAGVSFTQSYGASGSQALAIAAGQPADIAFLSTGLDVDTLVRAGLVAADWTKAPHGGIAADSVVVFVVRKGNPKHIKHWSDLIRPGVQVVTPNPFSSGSAKWNVLAAYGAMRRLGKTDAQATAFVQELFRHVVAQDSSGRNATNTFLAGKGDVLLTYESEAYAARQAGQDVRFVIPRQSMLIELPIVPLKSSPNLAVAKRFISFVQTEKAQEVFGQYGFRPVNAVALKKYFGTELSIEPGIFTIEDKLFGGWARADKTWFDPTNGRMVAIERKVGGPAGPTS
jgi:sulfate/thiosulfate transport system substrate-binding protein